MLELSTTSLASSSSREKGLFSDIFEIKILILHNLERYITIFICLFNVVKYFSKMAASMVEVAKSSAQLGNMVAYMSSDCVEEIGYTTYITVLHKATIHFLGLRSAGTHPTSPRSRIPSAGAFTFR